MYSSKKRLKSSKKRLDDALVDTSSDEELTPKKRLKSSKKRLDDALVDTSSDEDFEPVYRPSSSNPLRRAEEPVYRPSSSNPLRRAEDFEPVSRKKGDAKKGADAEKERKKEADAVKELQSKRQSTASFGLPRPSSSKPLRRAEDFEPVSRPSLSAEEPEHVLPATFEPRKRKRGSTSTRKRRDSDSPLGITSSGLLGKTIKNSNRLPSRADRAEYLNFSKRFQEEQRLREEQEQRLNQERINDSDTILRLITSSYDEKRRFIDHLNRCMSRWGGSVESRSKLDSDIYWFSKDRMIHLSLHFGISTSREGAFHIKITNNKLQNKRPVGPDSDVTVTFPIQVYLRKESNVGIDRNEFKGNHLSMRRHINSIPAYLIDKPFNPELRREQSQEIVNMMDDICRCLDLYFVELIRNRRTGGKVKTRRKTSRKNKTRKYK